MPTVGCVYLSYLFSAPCSYRHALARMLTPLSFPCSSFTLSQQTFRRGRMNQHLGAKPTRLRPLPSAPDGAAPQPRYTKAKLPKPPSKTASASSPARSLPAPPPQ
eukprot:m.91161 g.91161  ORF g.91161 m.91161 type:complete len:105 (-) comp12940_c0_seq1:321-635(-)